MSIIWIGLAGIAALLVVVIIVIVAATLLLSSRISREEEAEEDRRKAVDYHELVARLQKLTDQRVANDGAEHHDVTPKLVVS